MKEGFWLNYETKRYIELVCAGTDHEMCVRRPSNHAWLGVPARVAARFDRFQPVTERDAFLRQVMKSVPLIRIRGHLTHISIEFCSRRLARPFAVIGKWAAKHAGPQMPLNITNLATGRNWQVEVDQWGAFVESYRARKWSG